MKIALIVKQVPDTTSKVVLKSDLSGVDDSQFRYVLNPYDEFAAGEAVQTKEKMAGSELVVYSVGPKTASKSIRDVLAIGGDRGVLILDDINAALDPRNVVRALSVVLEQNGFDIIFMGKQAVDDDLSAVPQMLAEALSIPHATVVSKLEWMGTEGVRVERDIEGGQKELLEMRLPCIVAATKGLNKMRLASLLGIRAAAKKEIKEIQLSSLGVKMEPPIGYREWRFPAERGECRMITGEPPVQAKELVRLLREEAKAI